MTDERVTVYTRADWFHSEGPRAGKRMGDHDDPPVRYSVSPATPDAA